MSPKRSSGRDTAKEKHPTTPLPAFAPFVRARRIPFYLSRHFIVFLNPTAFTLQANSISRDLRRKSFKGKRVKHSRESGNLPKGRRGSRPLFQIFEDSFKGVFAISSNKSPKLDGQRSSEKLSRRLVVCSVREGLVRCGSSKLEAGLSAIRGNAESKASFRSESRLSTRVSEGLSGRKFGGRQVSQSQALRLGLQQILRGPRIHRFEVGQLTCLEQRNWHNREGSTRKRAMHGRGFHRRLE